MTRQELARKAVHDYGVPEHCADGLAGYLTGEYKHPGGFLRAVLSNDLKEAVLSADDININALGNYIRFLYNKAPAAAWGSQEKVRAWLARETTGTEE